MDYTRTVTSVFQTGDKAVLHLEARSGAVTVEAHDAGAVRVEATVHVWTDIPAEVDEAAALVSRGIEHDGHRVIVRAPSLPQNEGWSIWGGKRGSRIDYHVLVPVHTAVRVLSRSGGIRVAGIQGRLYLESGSGRCNAADVIGEVTAITRSGAIALERIHGNVNAEARSGRVEARRIDGQATVTARSGVTDVRDIGGDLRVQAHTGQISIERAAARVEARTHTGAIRYQGRVQGDFDVRAGTGMIHLAVDPENPFFIDAESDVGLVRSELPPRRNGGAPATGGPKVRLRTHTGMIRLSRL